MFHAQSVPSCACFTAVMSKEKDFFSHILLGLHVWRCIIFVLSFALCYCSCLCFLRLLSPCHEVHAGRIPFGARPLLTMTLLLF